MEETRRGVVIDVGVMDIKKIEKDLTVAPIVDASFGGFPKKHKYFVYNAKKTRIAVPRFYVAASAAGRAYGRADPAPDLVFRGALNPSLRQPEAVAATLDAMRTRGGAMLSLAPGHGKCFAKGTPVLMYDGSVRAVEDVGVGDAVMGDDATPRIVASLGRGREMMYDIVPTDGGRPFTCNESHILALIHPEHDTKIDIDVKKYLSLPEPLHMYRRPPQDGNIVTTPFEIVKREVDDYYGFTLAGTNHRFLLADFTVVHNTVCALKIACDIGLKTLIVVHKEFLMNQWIERVAQFVPTARVGRLQQKKAEVEGRDIVVAMIHSIALREYPPETFEGFGLTIVDEAHHVSAPIFSQAMFIANSPHVLGLTATPERKDGLQRVLHWFLGNIAYQSEREGRDDVKVEVARFDASHVPIPYNQRTGKMCLASFVTALTEDPDRNVLVMARVAAHHAAGRKIILLSDRRAHCETLLEACRRRGIDAGLYLGGMSPEDLEKSAARRVVLATFALATEGLDIPTLDTLVLATPKSDVVQATGRILRETTGKKRAPLIVDVVDSVGVAYAQFNKRKAFYLKAGFEIAASDGANASERTERPMFIDEEST